MKYLPNILLRSYSRYHYLAAVYCSPDVPVSMLDMPLLMAVLLNNEQVGGLSAVMGTCQD